MLLSVTPSITFKMRPEKFGEKNLEKNNKIRNAQIGTFKNYCS